MASQKEIARLAKVSQSVVSRVLTGNAKAFGIADATIERIRSIAEALDYRPNQAANMLLGRQTRLIGVIVRSFEDQFLATVLEEMNACALRAGYTLLVVGLESGEFNAKEIRLLESYRPDAFVVLGTTDFSTWDNTFLDVGKPIIQIGQTVDDPRITTCGTDEPEAARLLVEHLTGLGHTRIGIIGDNTPASSQRAARIREAMHAAQLPISLPFCYLSEKVSAAAGQDAAHYFLQDSDFSAWPTVFISTGDLIALSFIRHLSDAGIEVPSMLSVASYNDIDTASLTRPSLTTVRQPIRKMGRTGMDIAIGNLPLTSVTLPPVLKVRESTARARTANS